MPQSTPSFPFKLLYWTYRHVFPLVHRELKNWRSKAENIPDAELKKQAIASMTTKQFHCEGGSIYAVAGMKHRHQLVPLIVAFQTISDYLDNLCDRSTSLDPHDFRQLHQSMLDAVNPDAPLQDYYKYRQEKEDGGYLSELVTTCQQQIRQFPHYELVREPIMRFVSLYRDLQVHKHVDPKERESRLQNWWNTYRKDYPDLRWYEFAAATGSTLGVFMLFNVACESAANAERVEQVVQAYFPWVCGLHILLDYLIDQGEDEVGGDLNFCAYYENSSDTIERLQYFREQARKQCDSFPDRAFHIMIVEGLLGLYLSDQKVRKQQRVATVSRGILKRSRWSTILFYLNSRLYRFVTN